MSSSAKARYKQAPIWSVASLARCLGVAATELEAVAAESNGMYRVVLQLKKDGTPRECYDAEPRLKQIQERIKTAILRNVAFPAYVMGGISGSGMPRDYVANASMHSGAMVLINEDIASFFGSVSENIIYEIWRRFFGFSPPVCALLTALTTRNGVLPQGAKTSQHLANLVFWRTEPILQMNLEKRGIRYSRWVDDLTLSSPSDLSNETVTQVLSDCVGMVRRQGLSIKRKKHSLKRSGELMEVTGAVLAKSGPVAGSKRRSQVRAAVHRCEMLAKTCPGSPETSQAISKAAGMVGQLGRLHPQVAAQLRGRLGVVKRIVKGK